MEDEWRPKRPDSPQVNRRRSWPAAPRSILKKKQVENDQQIEVESGLGSSASNGGQEDIIKLFEAPGPRIGEIQDEGNSAGTVGSAATVVSARTVRKRRIAGIFQHYYPEGGWGYVILIVAFLAQAVAQGLQLGLVVLVPFAMRRYQVGQTEAGKEIYLVRKGVL
jgi:hypothetical protein